MSPNSTVVLSFKLLDLERGFDKVTIYKRKTYASKNESKLQHVKSYSGNVIPDDLIMENSLSITFTSDDSVTRQGFLLTWVIYKGKSMEISTQENQI